jgi:nucleotide-binding universal stress UspA family protein
MQGSIQTREWGRIAVPVAGLGGDAERLTAAADIAARFDAEVAAIFAPPDPGEVTPWLGEGFGGGMQIGVSETLQEAARAGEAAARAAFTALDYPRKALHILQSPVWRSVAVQCRLADLVVFNDAGARGRGPFAETFEQVLIEERAAVLVARAGRPTGAALVAWDGSDGASRAARRAVPLLRHAERIVIAGAPPSETPCELSQLQAYLALRGLSAEVRPFERHGSDAGAQLLELAAAEGAGLIVAGAFGKSRLREFIFGGATRALLQADGPSLFLAH